MKYKISSINGRTVVMHVESANFVAIAEGIVGIKLQLPNVIIKFHLATIC